jgi:hypothetical protein
VRERKKNPEGSPVLRSKGRISLRLLRRGSAEKSDAGAGPSGYHRSEHRRDFRPGTHLLLSIKHPSPDDPAA